MHTRCFLTSYKPSVRMFSYPKGNVSPVRMRLCVLCVSFVLAHPAGPKRASHHIEMQALSAILRTLSTQTPG